MSKPAKPLKHPKKKRRKTRRGSSYPTLPEELNLSLLSTYRWNSTISAGALTNATVNLSDLNEFQPYYYDQLMTIYKNWVVVGVEVEYRVINRSYSYDGQLIVFELNRRNYDSGLTLPVSESLPGAQRYFLSSTGKDKTVIIRRNIDLSRYYPSTFLNDSDFWGDYYNSPSICTETLRKMNIYSVILYSAADGTSSVQFTTDRRIRFRIRFFSFWYQNISLNDPKAVEDPESKPQKDKPETIVEAETPQKQRSTVGSARFPDPPKRGR